MHGRDNNSTMLREIREQPAVLERTLVEELPNAKELKRMFGKSRPRLIVLAARGTSDNAAQFGRYLLEVTTGIPVSLAAPSIFTLYDASLNLHGALVVAISQSGESTDTNLVLEKARSQGALTIGVTNESGSTLARLAERMFLVRAGKEESVAATKTYTGQLLAFYLLAYALGARIAIDDLRRLAEWASKALSIEPQIAERAERYRFMEHAAVIARGLNYSNAFEFALKLMETCYVVAERFSSADVLHGPIAMVDAAFPVFMFSPAGVTWQGHAALLDKLTGLKADTLLVTDEANEASIDKVSSSRQRLCIPARLSAGHEPADLYTPIPYIIPAQLFAAHLASVKGLDADHPRALNKVTRTL